MGILEETYQLNDGNRIPRLAFGTWQMDDDTAESSVAKALAAGYRHIDTAVQYENERGVVVEAFSPNATGKLRGNPTIEGMAARYGVSVPQLAIRFDLQLGVVPLPKTTHEEYMRSNADVDFNISEGDMNTLLAVDEIRSL